MQLHFFVRIWQQLLTRLAAKTSLIFLSIFLSVFLWSSLYPSPALARATASQTQAGQTQADPARLEQILEARSPAIDNPSNIQPYIDRVMNRITEFKLDNGMKFIVMERHQAPVVSFMTYVNIGAAYEEEGKTGAAHFLEHLAFKGTTKIGSKNYASEKPKLEQLDRLFDQLKVARAANKTEEVTRLQAEFDKLKLEAATFVVKWRGWIECHHFGRCHPILL
jgi:hypothetical protein